MGRNTIYLPEGKVKKESSFLAALRIASWFTGFVPLITISLWGIANSKAQDAVKERAEYWGSLCFDNSKWEVPEKYRSLYYDQEGRFKYHHVKLDSFVEEGYASWLANTGVPKTIFQQVFTIGSDRSLFSPLDGHAGVLPPPNVAEKLLVITRIKDSKLASNTVAYTSPDKFLPEGVERGAPHYQINSVLQEYKGNLRSSFPHTPDFNFLAVLWSGKAEVSPYTQVREVGLPTEINHS